MTATAGASAPLGEGDLPELYRSGRTKLRRARRNRLISYAIGLVLAAAVVARADWSTIHEQYFNWTYAKETFPDIVTVAAKNTIVYTLGAFVGGVTIGLVMAFLKMSALRPYRWFATVYIEIFRGLPALLTILIVGLVTPGALNIQFPVVLGVESAGILALSLVAGAYLAETIRAGIEGVPGGQIEAARSLGMTHGQTQRIIVFPQAMRLVVPPLTNELVLLLKDTSLLSRLGTTAATVELTQYGLNGVTKNFNGTPLIVAGVMYLMITIPLTQLVAWLERRNKARR